MFETEHLKIRKFKIEDVPVLYQIHQEEGVKRWFPNESYADIEETLGAIQFYLDCVESEKLPYVLAVELKETGELIGDTGVSAVEGKRNEVEVGYVITEKYSGKGYASELLRGLSEFIHKTFSVSVLYGRVIHGNHASAKVLEKSGYSFVAEEFGADDDPYGGGMLIYKKSYGFQGISK